MVELIYVSSLRSSSGMRSTSEVFSHGCKQKERSQTVQKGSSKIG